MSGGEKKPVLAALIVGCGAIAGGYDEDGGDAGSILSHGGAYRAHPGIETIACIEPDAARRRAFMDHWSVPHGFADLEGYRQSGLHADIASMCAPTPAHEAAMMGLVDLGLKVVLCEKPISADPQTSARIVKAYEDGGVALAVNYLRRWVPGIVALKGEIAQGRWGALQSAVGSYNKGVLNCGSHMIDLIHFLIGPLTPRTVLHVREGLGPHDPTVDAFLEGPGGTPMYLIGAEHRHFFTFELDMTFEKGRIVLEDLGRAIRVRPLSQDRAFSQRRTLLRGQWRESGLGQAMELAVDNLYRYVLEGAALMCDGRTALEAETQCHRLIDLAREKQMRDKGV